MNKYYDYYKLLFQDDEVFSREILFIFTFDFIVILPLRYFCIFFFSDVYSFIFKMI